MLTNALIAIIYGIVEGVCEWLPISSTGHLILLEELLPLNMGAELGKEFAEQFRSAFDVVIQLGAILAIPVIYRRDLIPTSRENRSLWYRSLIAMLPAAAVGLCADAVCERVFGRDLDSLLFHPAIVAASLITYGVLFMAVERISKSTKAQSKRITYGRAFAIGCFQALAIVPGTSRSGSTILGARLLRADKAEATRFSFFAAIPIIASASALKIFEFSCYLAREQIALPLDCLLCLLLSSLTAFALSFASVVFLTDFIKRHSFAPFGVYRIALGALVLAFMRP